MSGEWQFTDHDFGGSDYPVEEGKRVSEEQVVNAVMYQDGLRSLSEPLPAPGYEQRPQTHGGGAIPENPFTAKFRQMLEKESPLVQAFTTGATRSDDSGKNDYEGFLSPLVLEAYADYMTEHRVQDDGKVRASDNWQRGMPFHKYIKSLYRHFLQLWQLHRGYTPKPEKRAGKLVPVTVTSAVSGILFNTMGYFHEYLMDSAAWADRIVSEPEDGDVVRGPQVRKRAAQQNPTTAFDKAWPLGERVGG